MKVQCILCKEIVEIGPFRSSDAGIDVDCSACGGSFFVESGGGEQASSAVAESAPASPASDEDGAIECPKCGESQPEADACRACGLRADLFEVFEHESPAASAELGPLWEKCVTDWDAAAAHDAFVDAAAATNAFAFAARRYREAQRDRPRDTAAPKQLARLARLAEATLLSSVAARNKLPKADEPYKNVMILLIFLVLCGGIAGVWVLMKKSAPDSKQKPNVPTKVTPKHR